MVFKKGIDKLLSKHFSTKDFDCHCTYPECQETLIEEDLIEALEDYIELVVEFSVVSGYRCVRHNKEVGGGVNSYHLEGKAADCKSKRYNGRLMAQYADDIPQFKAGGIGRYPTFCHVDIGPQRRWVGK